MSFVVSQLFNRSSTRCPIAQIGESDIKEVRWLYGLHGATSRRFVTLLLSDRPRLFSRRELDSPINASGILLFYAVKRDLRALADGKTNSRASSGRPTKKASSLILPIPTKTEMNQTSQ